MTRKSALAAASLLALVLAQPRVGAPASPCGDDAAKFCPEVTPAKGTLLGCLRPHMSELTEACRRTLQRIDKRKEIAAQRRLKARTVRAGMRTPVPTAAATPAK